MATTVGALSVDLDLNSASFINNMKKATDAVTTSSKSIERALGFAQGAVGGFVASLTIDAALAATKGALDYTDAIADLSDQIGVGTKTLQEFRYAAQLSGSSTEDADLALAKFAKTLGEAQRGSKKQQELFNDLGVSIRDARGEFLSIDQVLPAFADAVERAGTQQERTAIITEAMGKSAGSLAILLAGGSKEMEQLSQAANNLGIVLEDHVLRNSGAVNDKLDQMKMILSARFASVVVENSDALLGLANSVLSLGDAMLRGISISGRYYAGLADVYRNDGLLAGLKETFFGTPESQQNTAARGAAKAGTFRMKGFIDPAAPPPPPPAPPMASDKSGPSRTKKTPEASWLERAMRGDFDTPPPAFDANLAFTATLPAARMDIDAIYATMNDIQELPPVEVVDEAALAMLERASLDVSSAMADWIVYGGNLGDVLVNSAKRFLAEMTQNAIFDALGGLFGGKGGGTGFLSSLFGGKREKGGPVQRGRGYIVGEKGPEWFMPDGAGTIISNDTLRNMGGESRGVHITVGIDPKNGNITAFVDGQIAATAPAIAQAGASMAQGQAAQRQQRRFR